MRRLPFVVPLLAPLALLAAHASAQNAPRREVVAVAAERPVRVDGVLDDEVWARAEPATGFVQSEPHEGEPSTEETEVRVAYDAEHLFIGARMRDRDAGRVVVNDIRKDFFEGDQDTFEVILDTFGDRRNGYVFITNAEGARSDRQISNEGREVNTSWDAAWEVKTRRTADGWTAELAIPFRALRFDDRAGARWGINFSRRIRRENEITFWAPVPRAYTLSRLSLAGDLVGLATGGAGRDLRVKPYVASRSTRDVGVANGRVRGDVGADVKYGLTPGLTLDATVNPDFAQVEADEQQVNLTQFSQFFPEKREFFLENSGTFYVGDAARNNRVSVAPTSDEDLVLFFSRRVGLDSLGVPVPIDGGLRLTGKAGGLGVGAMAIRTRERDSLPSNTYAVVRLKKNLGGGSDVGVIFMDRDASGALPTSVRKYDRVYGGDATVRFFGRLDWNAYAVKSDAAGIGSDSAYAARTSLNFEGNQFHGKAGVMLVGGGFDDELGWVRRTGVRKYFDDVGLRFRPAALRRFGVREMHPHTVWNYYEGTDGRLAAKRLHTGYTFFMQSGAYAELSWNPAYERLTSPLELDPRVSALPAGGYGWQEWQLRGETDPSRALSVEYTGIVGGLWTGTQRTVDGSLVYHPDYRFRVSAGAERTDARLRDRPSTLETLAAVAPAGSPGPRERFVATLYTGRASYSFTTNMLLDALAQYDPATRTMDANVRFNVIHHPLSDFYVVFNEQRLFDLEGRPTLSAGRSVIVKVTQMVAF